MTTPTTEHCRKCKRAVAACGECEGSGEIEGEVCDVCMGERVGCPVHHTDWQSTKTH